MPKTKDAKKRKSKPLNHNHNHNEVHIHIGNKKTKSSRRRRAPAGPHIGAVINTHTHAIHAAPPGYAQPAYAFPTNRPQFFDPTTQVDRERNQLMAPAPVFSSQVPTQGTGFRPIPAAATPPPPQPDTTPAAETPPLTEREMHPPMVDTYDQPQHTAFAFKSDASWMSPAFFSNENPMHHSGVKGFRDDNAASRRAREQEEESEREREWEDQREIARKVAAFDANQEKRAATNAKTAATKAANKKVRDAAAEQKTANEAGQRKKWGSNVTGMGLFNKG